MGLCLCYCVVVGFVGCVFYDFCILCGLGLSCFHNCHTHMYVGFVGLGMMV